MSLVIQNLQNILHTTPIKLQIKEQDQEAVDNSIMEYTSEILIDSLLHSFNTREWFEKSSKESSAEFTTYTYRFIFNNVYNKLRVTFDFSPVNGISTLKEPCMYFKSNLYFDWMGKGEERRDDLALFLTTTLAKVFFNAETDKCIIDYYVPIKDTESIIDIPATYLRWVDCEPLRDVFKNKYEYIFPGIRILINKVIEYQDEISKGKITKLLQTIIGEGLDE